MKTAQRVRQVCRSVYGTKNAILASVHAPCVLLFDAGLTDVIIYKDSRGTQYETIKNTHWDPVTKELTDISSTAS